MLVQRRTDHIEALLRAPGRREVDALTLHRPLREVDVVVPQSRHDPSSLRRDGLDGRRGDCACGHDRFDGSTAQEHIDGSVLARKGCVGDEAVIGRPR
jgi:hypothetical protein